MARDLKRLALVAPPALDEDDRRVEPRPDTMDARAPKRARTAAWQGPSRISRST